MPYSMAFLTLPVGSASALAASRVVTLLDIPPTTAPRRSGWPLGADMGATLLVTFNGLRMLRRSGATTASAPDLTWRWPRAGRDA